MLYSKQIRSQFSSTEEKGSHGNKDTPPAIGQNIDYVPDDSVPGTPVVLRKLRVQTHRDVPNEGESHTSPKPSRIQSSRAQHTSQQRSTRPQEDKSSPEEAAEQYISVPSLSSYEPGRRGDPSSHSNPNLFF